MLLPKEEFANNMMLSYNLVKEKFILYLENSYIPLKSPRTPL